jgi:branched-chain amino acid transport system substrate-binding protein
MRKMSLREKLFFIFWAGFFCPLLLISSSWAGPKDPINIGLTMDFSGVTAQIGIRETVIIKNVVKEANDAGGINGRPIKLFVLDNGSDPSKVTGNLKMLKELNKCVAMMEGVNSTCGIAAKAWADRNHIPIMTEGAMTDLVLQREGKAWFFKSCGSTWAHADATLKRLKELGYTKVAFQGSTLAWGVDVLDTVKKQAPKIGVQLVGEVLCEPKSKDLTIQAMKLRDTGAQAVICADYEAEIGVWARALKTIGWKPFSFSYSSGLLSTAMKISPPELFEGWETTQIIDDSKPLVKKIWNQYEALSGKRWDDDQTPRAWDGMSLLLEAVKLSGKPDDPAAIRDGFYKIKGFPIACGRLDSKGSFAIGRNESLTPDDMMVYTVKSGKLVVVKKK